MERNSGRRPSKRAEALTEIAYERLQAWAFLADMKPWQLIDALGITNIEEATEAEAAEYPIIDELIQIRQDVRERPPEVHFPYQQRFEFE